MSRTDEVKGQRFLVNGADTTTIRELIPLLEKKLGLPEGQTNIASSKIDLGLGLTDFIEEFFTGITHDKNMARMVEYFDQHTPVFDTADFFKKLGLQHKVRLSDFT